LLSHTGHFINRFSVIIISIYNLNSTQVNRADKKEYYTSITFKLRNLLLTKEDFKKLLFHCDMRILRAYYELNSFQKFGGLIIIFITIYIPKLTIKAPHANKIYLKILGFKDFPPK